ncbi:WG repeat-containing protein, partial [Leptospira bandrabouensis]|uniref:WG repeat-containing protein n=2 Tax=Leptospira TaxID=171 RepID=UPI001EE8E9D3
DFDENGVAFVAGEKGWSCINSDNKILLNSFIFDNGPDYLSEGLARFVENKKIGFHDPGCKKTIQAEYDFAYPFENGFSIVCNGCRSVKTDEHSMIQGGNYGIINKKGEVVVPIEYDAVSLDENKVAHTIKGTLKKEIPVQ